MLESTLTSIDTEIIINHGFFFFCMFFLYITLCDNVKNVHAAVAVIDKASDSQYTKLNPKLEFQV